MRRISIVVIVVWLLAFGYLAGNAHLLRQSSLAAADDCQMFPATGFQACGDFLSYWRDHGGLAQQGYPISPTFQEKSDTDGKTYTVQYFERAVFEAHPENQPPNNVLLSLLGSQKYKAKYPNGQPSASAPAASSAPPTTAPATGDAIGQTLAVAKGTYSPGPFAITVTDIKRVKTIGTANASGIYAIFFLTVTNTGNAAMYLGSGTVAVLDAQGRTFSTPDSIAGQLAAEDQYKAKGYLSDIQPSLSTNLVYVFDVAPNATGLHLIPAKT